MPCRSATIDLVRVRTLLAEHEEETGSAVAARLLAAVRR